MRVPRPSCCASRCTSSHEAWWGSAGSCAPSTLLSGIARGISPSAPRAPDKSCKDLPELMTLNELEPIKGPTRAKTDCQSIVRLVNRMIR